MCTAYELYEKLEDSNVSYHVTMENVIDAIEKQILNGELRRIQNRRPVWC